MTTVGFYAILKSENSKEGIILKGIRYLLVSACVAANAIFLGLGLECLLNLLGYAMSLTLDSNPRYPRFIPFCLIMGILALVGIVCVFIVNIKLSDKFSFTKKIWCFQYVFALVLSVPMIKVWEMLFDFLRVVF